jgi:FKBP-type peptidyl-prolyl cis-trans isomerase
MRTVWTAFSGRARIGALFAAALALAACSKLTEPPRPEPTETTAGTASAGANHVAELMASASAAAAAAKPPEPPPPTNEKLETKDLVVGKSAEAKTGDKVSVHYVGTLTDGKEFDSSKKHGQPFSFDLGQGNVIKGWDQGVVGMKVGGKRKLTVPPSLGYGARGFPPVIPPNATLVFEVELLEVKKK